MNSRSRSVLFAVPLIFTASGSFLLAATLSIQDPQPRNLVQYSWNDGNIWNGGVPGSGDSAEMPAQFGDNLPVEVLVYLVQQNTTVASFSIEVGVTLEVDSGDFTVTGDSTTDGFIIISQGTMSLGNNLL